MKKFLLILAVVMIGALASPTVHALSIEQRDNTSSDGTAKYTDPDDQKPAFLITPNGSLNAGPLDSSRSSVNGPSVPEMVGAGQEGQNAFDRAYSHLQNK